jgi:histidine ammonia-lyase
MCPWEVFLCQFNQILGIEKILAIELMYAASHEFRRPNTFSKIIEENFKIIRTKVPKLEEDRLLKTRCDDRISENKSLRVK